MKVHPREFDKPVFFDQGRFVTLKDLSGQPTLAMKLGSPEPFRKLQPKVVKELVLKRYEKEPRNKVIHIIGFGSYSIDQLAAEVSANSNVGRLVMDKEILFINHLAKLAAEQKLEMAD